jgi:NTE family protein
MNVQAKPSVGGARRLLPFELIALVLQGGRAPGAYQAGVYEALAGRSVTARCWDSEALSGANMKTLPVVGVSPRHPIGTEDRLTRRQLSPSQRRSPWLRYRQPSERL